MGKNVAKGVLAGSYYLAFFSVELPRAVKFPTALVLSWHFFGNRGKKKKKELKKKEEGENLVKNMVNQYAL